MKCVYCIQNETQVSFRGEEHIIPQSLGGKSFPAITRGIICDKCNSLVFSKLEIGFKQDTYEGVFCQMLGLSDSQSVWIRGKNLNMSTVTGFGDNFFNELFPFLKFENNITVIDIKPQLKVRNKVNGFQVFPLKTLQEIKDSKPRDFKRLKERISKTSNKDLAIFTGTMDESTNSIDEAIKLISDYGITYTEKERKFIATEEIEGNGVALNWEGTLDNDIMRVIAKIAFNYFIYCSICEEGSQYKDILFSSNFDKIRNFILQGNINWKEIISLSEMTAIGGTEGAIAHCIYFTLENEVITAYVSLFGHKIYKIIIGKYPFSLLIPSFGCGHAFEPFSNTVHALGTDRYSLNRLMDRGYGWFKT